MGQGDSRAGYPSKLFSLGNAEKEPEIRQPRRIFLHIASRAPAYRNKRLIETAHAVFELMTLAASINRPFDRASVLTLLSKVTHNPASHKSEAGVIYCRYESLRQSAGRSNKSR